MSHDPTRATGANTTTLAREGDEAIMSTLSAVEAGEATLELTAGEVAGEGEVDEAGQRLTLMSEARLEAR